MGVEIERKFLVTGDAWRNRIEQRKAIEQGYLSTDPDRTIRVRVIGERGVLTIKGRAHQLVRPEFDYDIPVDDARQMLDNFCGGRRIEKIRYDISVGDHRWVIDEFSNDNRGLVVAEVELASADESFRHPEWIGREVTGDARYYNARLAERPFQRWEDGSSDPKGEQ